MTLIEDVDNRVTEGNEGDNRFVILPTWVKPTPTSTPVPPTVTSTPVPPTPTYTPTAAPILYSNYGTTRYHVLTITAGWRQFEAEAIAAFKNTEWYADGLYLGFVNSGFSANNPTYRVDAPQGYHEVIATIYNSSGGFEEQHTWSVTVVP